MPLIRSILEYLLGFIAMAVFAAYAFANGMPTNERWEKAFLLGAGLGCVELAVLFLRTKPANRLILGANLWLIAGGAAVLMQQWWLKGVELAGEAGIVGSMLVVGLMTTVFSKAGFVGAFGSPSAVRNASYWLLVFTFVALIIAVCFRGNIRYAAIMPIIVLAWINRFLRFKVQRST